MKDFNPWRARENVGLQLANLIFNHEDESEVRAVNECILCESFDTRVVELKLSEVRELPADDLRDDCGVAFGVDDSQDIGVIVSSDMITRDACKTVASIWIDDCERASVDWQFRVSAADGLTTRWCNEKRKKCSND